MIKNIITKDKDFYNNFFTLFITLALQNIITYSVNVADNVMLGTYSQLALNGAAAANQVQYILQQFSLSGLGAGLAIMCSQYFGKNDKKTIQKLTGIALIIGLLVGIALSTITFISPMTMAKIFTDDINVQNEAIKYFSIMLFTYPIFITTNILLTALRSIQIVKIAFRLSCFTLVLNTALNYILIFGSFGFPELGISGAAIGTLISRICELIIIVIYLNKAKLPIKFNFKEMLSFDLQLFKDFFRVTVPCIISAFLFSTATAAQTAIFGHMSSNELAASSAASVLFQYCKMIPSSVAAATNIIIAKIVGGSETHKIKPYTRTLQCLFILTGITTCILLLIIAPPVISIYSITEEAKILARYTIIIQGITLIFCSYQMPCQLGIIRGGGDTRYVMISDFIYSYIFTIPLGLIAAFVFNMPYLVVLFCLNLDQYLKCITVSFKVNRYTWLKNITRT
ncbi:MAG: MATE family efflux transporter [Lachnospirales bacterium]